METKDTNNNNNSNYNSNGNGKQTWPWMILITVIIGTFIGRLDQTIVNLAMPKIIDDYGITVSSAGWINTAYILANAVFVPIWGKLGDTIGRKKVYILGFTIFIIGSMLAGFAWSLTSMIIFRVIQAIAGSADYPTAMSIISVNFKDPKDRAQALGIWSASFAAAVVFGPLVGGPLIDHFGWRSVFFINLPIGLIGLTMAFIYIKESMANIKTQVFDWWGSITLGISLSSLVLVLDKGLDWGWLSLNSSLAYFIFVTFIWIFIRVELNQENPIVDLKFFKNNVFVNTLVNNFIVFMGMMGSMFLIPVFIQTFLGYNATETGYVFIPMAACMMIAAQIGGRLTGRIQPRYVIFTSTIVASLGFFIFSFLDVRSSVWDVILGLCIMALGMGLGMAQRTSVIAGAVPEEEIGIASSVLALIRNISGAFGIALFGTILNYTNKAKVIEIGQNSIIHSHSPQIYQQFVSLITLKAQIEAYDAVFFTSFLIVFIGSFTALFIKVNKDISNVKVIVES